MPDFDLPSAAGQGAHDAALADPTAHLSDSPASEWEQHLQVAGHEEATSEIPLQDLSSVNRSHPGASGGGEAMVETAVNESHSQSITAAGQGTSSAYDAHTFQQGLVGQAPASVAGVRFPALNDAYSSNINHRNAQFIHNLYDNSPTFQNTVDTTTQGGQQPIDIHYGQVAQGYSAQYDLGQRRVVLNPTHPDLASGGLGKLQGATAFELTNAANSSHFEQIGANRSSGHYERAAAAFNAHHPGQRPVTGGELFARDMESVEWQSTKKHHQSMQEAAAGGMPMLPNTDLYERSYGNNPGPSGSWDNMENHHACAAATGHTQLYINAYNHDLPSFEASTPDRTLLDQS